MNTRAETLREPPRLLRANIARGLRQLAASDEPEAAPSPVDPTGGDQAAGLIRGMAILTRGEAKGHCLWCDHIMLAQAQAHINATPAGTKARFTHPGASGDGLGKFTGRVKDAELDTDVLRGDLHFSSSAHRTPDGDLAGYLLQLAKDDPESFGNSIAFEPDIDAEIEFAIAHGAEWIEDEDWGTYLSFEHFKSPDPENVNNYPHARIAALQAVDAVDDPAANPSGLFHRADNIAQSAEKLAAYALGFSTERPTSLAFDADPDRVRGFITRFLTRHNLTLTAKDASMPAPKSTAQLDAELRQHFGTRPGIKPRIKLAADDKEDKSEQSERAAQEEGDADKDEGKDKGKDEKRGDNYASGAAGRKLKSDEGDGDDEEMEDGKKPEGFDEDEDKEKEQEKQLAKGGEAPGADGAADEASRQKGYQDVQEEEEEGSKKPAKKGAAVEPADGKEAIGPQGDPSHNVGYSKAVADCKRFTKAFGAQGAVWFSEGKTFEQAQELHVAQLKADNKKLREENEQLAKKVGAKRGLSAPLSGETSVAEDKKTVTGSHFSQFTAGLAAQLNNRGNLN